MTQTGAGSRLLEWRLLGAFLGAGLTYLVVSTGLATSAALEVFEFAVFVGVVAGVLSTSPLQAAVSSVLALAAGVILVPPWFSQDSIAMMVLIPVLGLAIATASRLVIDLGIMRERWLVAVALVILVACTVYVANSIANAPDPQRNGLTRLDQLGIRPIAGQAWDDGEFYRAVVWHMRDGMSYLDAYRLGFRENARWGKDPDVAFAVRTPLLFQVWKLAPGWPSSPFWLLLLLGAVAMFASPFVVSRAVSPVLGVTGAAGLAVYFFGYLFAPGLLFMSEIWSGLLAVLVLAAFALSQRDRAGRGWLVAAAVLTLIAAMTRELMVFLFIAGFAAAFFSPKGRRRFELIVWGSSLGAFALFYGAHVLSARRILTPIQSRAFMWFQHGGIQNLWSGLTSTTMGFRWLWIPGLLAALGVLGALAQRDIQYRVFASVAVLLPLVGFLLVGTDAVRFGTNIPYNYWGGIVVPSLFVLAPASLGWIPGMRVGASRPALQEETPSEDEESSLVTQTDVS